MKRILSISVVLLFTFGSMAQTGADLKLNLEKNKVYRFVSISEQTIVQTVNGRAQNVESKSRYALSLKMVDATAGFMITEVRFDTIDIRTNTMGKTSLISSAGEGSITSTETSDIMTYFMNRFARNALFVKMDFTGKVLEIVNSKMFSAILLKDTASVTLAGPLAAALKTQVANMVSDNALTNMIEMFTYNLPGKQVSADDHWIITQTMNAGGMDLRINTSYHLDDLHGNLAGISAEADIKAAENAEPVNSGGAKVTYDELKGISKSNLVIDTTTGLLTESSGKTRISGNLGVTMPGLSMQIPMEINGETKVKALN